MTFVINVTESHARLPIHGQDMCCSVTLVRTVLERRLQGKNAIELVIEVKEGSMGLYAQLKELVNKI